MFSSVNLPRVQEFITTTIPNFVRVTIPLKLQEARTTAINGFMNANPLIQAVTAIALVILLSGTIYKLSLFIWRACHKPGPNSLPAPHSNQQIESNTATTSAEIAPPKVSPSPQPTTPSTPTPEPAQPTSEASRSPQPPAAATPRAEIAPPKVSPSHQPTTPITPTPEASRGPQPPAAPAPRAETAPPKISPSPQPTTPSTPTPEPAQPTLKASRSPQPPAAATRAETAPPKVSPSPQPTTPITPTPEASRSPQPPAAATRAEIALPKVSPSPQPTTPSTPTPEASRSPQPPAAATRAEIALPKVSPSPQPTTPSTPTPEPAQPTLKASRSPQPPAPAPRAEIALPKVSPSPQPTTPSTPTPEPAQPTSEASRSPQTPAAATRAEIALPKVSPSPQPTTPITPTPEASRSLQPSAAPAPRAETTPTKVSSPPQSRHKPIPPIPERNRDEQKSGVPAPQPSENGPSSSYATSSSSIASMNTTSPKKSAKKSRLLKRFAKVAKLPKKKSDKEARKQLSTVVIETDERSWEEKRSVIFERLVSQVSRLPDASFDEEGLIRVSASKAEKDKLKRDLINNVHIEIESVMVLAILKDFIKEMNLFHGDLQDRLLSFGESPPKEESQIILTLKELVSRLPTTEQHHLNSFMKILHRITEHSVQNKMNAENIAISINDLLSPLASEAEGSTLPPLEQMRLFDSKLGKIRTFTSLLIQHYPAVFLS